MILRVNQSIISDEYQFVFSIDQDSITTDELNRVKKFGAPSINFGGTFTLDDLSFTLPDVNRFFPADFPVTQLFSPVDPWDTDTADKLELYRTTMCARITNAITSLRNTADTFTGQYITNI
jgi:hypothetical protein